MSASCISAGSSRSGRARRCSKTRSIPIRKSLMEAVPIADPSRRKSGKDLNFKPIPSPIYPVGYQPPPSEYDEVTPGHFLLTSDSGY